MSENTLTLNRITAEIDLDAVKNNFLILKKVAAGKKVLAVVKANAYGHGAPELSALYEKLGADYLAVSNIDEAMEIRRSGVGLPILILGLVPPHLAPTAAEQNFTLALYSLPYARALSNVLSRSGKCVKVHLKFDTGMGRIGFLPEETGDGALPDALAAASFSCFEVEGAFAHFSSADGGCDAESADYTALQAERFSRAAEYMRSHGVPLDICHVSNSAATLDYPELSLDMVRIGISLYGLAPSNDVKAKPAIMPVMTLKSIISHIKTVPAGTAISYGRTFVSEKEMRVATVPVGYADGFFRSSSASGVKLTVRGVGVRILGRVCMDQLMIDVTDVRDAALFDEVLIFGKGARESADSYAEKNGTIGYEAVCAVGRRVPRVYLQDGEIKSVKDYLL